MPNIKSADDILRGLAEIILGFKPGINHLSINQNTFLLEGGLELDSVVLVDMIGEIEKRFGIEFQDADLRTRTFQTIGTLTQVIMQRM